MTLLLQSVLYFFGPFYCYPWKPVLGVLWGNSYPVGFKHFYDQHRHPTNLAWHAVCLFYQSIGNFALLNAVDQMLPNNPFYDRPLSLLTLVSWIIVLIPPKECPTFIKVGSIAALLTAFTVGPMVTALQIEFACYVGFFIVGLYHISAYSANFSSWSQLLAGALVAKFILCYVLNFFARGLLVSYSDQITYGYLLLMILVSFKKNPLKEMVVLGSFGCALLSIFLDRDILFYFSGAFTATLMQGASHALSGEEATLLKLENVQDEYTKMTYEFAHVVYFPNLLLHAVYEVVRSKQRYRRLAKPPKMT